MHIWRMRLREVQLQAAIEEGGRWQAALEAARALLPCYRLVYPQVHACMSVLRGPSLQEMPVSHEAEA